MSQERVQSEDRRQGWILKFYSPLICYQRDRNQQRNSRRIQRHEEQQQYEQKQSGVLYISILNKKGIKLSALEGAKNEIHWHGIFLNNLLFDGFSWLIVLLFG